MTGREGQSNSVWRAGAALALMLAALEGPARAATQPELFVPPAGPLQLTRTLRRPLPDGKAIISTRRYTIRIVREGDGYRVDGELAEALIDAPPSLGALAEIERNRPDTGMFPITLDARGMIVGEDPVHSNESFDHAAAAAASQIGKSGMVAIDMLQAQAFVQQLRTRAARSHWPADVFNPAPGRTSEQRTIPLPDGREGHALVEIAASGRGVGGQIAEIERKVTTDLGGDKRLTDELWQLSRAQ
jgi:hypothetical protein